MLPKNLQISLAADDDPYHDHIMHAGISSQTRLPHDGPSSQLSVCRAAAASAPEFSHWVCMHRTYPGDLVERIRLPTGILKWVVLPVEQDEADESCLIGLCCKVACSCCKVGLAAQQRCSTCRSFLFVKEYHMSITLHAYIFLGMLPSMSEASPLWHWQLAPNF